MAGEANAPTVKREVQGRRIPGQTVRCGWCDAQVQVPSRGRVPKWCSPRCRHRAWEQKRAAESGRSAVEVVQQPVAHAVTRIEEREVRVPDPNAPRSAPQWRELLRKLDWALSSRRFDEADLDLLEPAIVQAFAALRRRREGLQRERQRGRS